MELKKYCIEENLSWCNRYAKAYRAQINEDTVHTVLCYQIPFVPEEELIFLERYRLPAARRMSFYQNLAKCIQHTVRVSELLNNSGVPSILQYYCVEQERDSNGVTYILLETEEIWPICYNMLSGEVERITALNVVARLSVILRDIAKPPHSIVLRGFDIDEVYVNKDNRIMLAGLYYAYSPMLTNYPDYLPGRPNNIVESVAQGFPGTPGTDMYSLSCFAWNLFSGVPLRAQVPASFFVYPQYGTDELAEILYMGREGRDEDLAAFRRRLSDCRKMISKASDALVRIPIREQRSITYEVQTVE